MIISGTQITTYNSCTLAHHYMYDLGLGPVELSMPLYRGQLGHSALETYYSLRAEGFSSTEAGEGAYMIIEGEMGRIGEEEPWNDKKIKEASQIGLRIREYPKVYEDEPFKVIAIEKEYRAPMAPSIQFGFIVDLLVEMQRGPRKGQTGVIDHKFSYNWKTPAELTLDAQLPKYRKALQLNGFPVEWIMFNQIRTREMKYAHPRDMFKRAFHMATDKASEVIWAEQKETALDIQRNVTIPRRSLAPMVCKSCFFKEPCMMSMNGQDTTKVLLMDFEKRTRPLKELYND